jgi:hypothetical protein
MTRTKVWVDLLFSGVLLLLRKSGFRINIPGCNV